MKIKGVRLYGVKDIRLEEFEIPDITEDEVLLKIECNGIAMSTLKRSLWHSGIYEYQRILRRNQY